MSYILDALRRADAERSRGGVPGLHAQAHAGDAADTPHRRGGLPWAGIAVALGLALLVVLLWLGFAPVGAPPEQAPPVPSVPPPPAPAPVAAAEPAAPPPAAAAVTAAPPPPAATLPALPPPTPVPVARAPAPRAEAARSAPAASAAAEPRVPALRELPEELRRQIPPLNVGGSTWSANAASRFVILNGQLLRENETLTPELTLRQIRQRSLVLEFRGQRFELPF